MRTALRPLAVVMAIVLLGACSSDDDDDAGPAGPQDTPTTAASGDGGSAATTTLSPTAALTWRLRAAAPTSRQEVAGAVVDGRIWVVGGLTASDTSTRVESYDPAADRWSAGPDLPLALHHLAVAAYRGELVVVGGFGRGVSDLYDRPSDRVLALRGGNWVDLPRLRRPRGAAAAAVAGDVLYVVGGRDAGLLVAPTEAFDGSAWQDKAPIPAPRDHIAAASDGQSVFAVGGRLLNPDRTSAVLERYDPGRDAWEQLPAMPTARGGLGACMLGGRIIAAGGESSSAVFPQVEAYDIATRSWSSLPAMTTARHGHAMATVGNGVYALVGGGEAGVAPTTVAEVLAPA